MKKSLDFIQNFARSLRLKFGAISIKSMPDCGHEPLGYVPTLCGKLIYHFLYQGNSIFVNIF